MAEQIEKKAPSADKLKALQLAMEKIEKEHGKGTIMKMGEEKVEDINVIPTGTSQQKNTKLKTKQNMIPESTEISCSHKYRVGGETVHIPTHLTTVFSLLHTRFKPLAACEHAA